jgi:YD repeat-containing protein
MKQFYLLILNLLIVLFVKSQNSGPYKHLSNYTQPAPNAAALGKYVDFPIGYYTGTPNISIPLYELKDGAAQLPISLNYHGSGIKVSEVASWVGIGWSLQAGGMITRSIQGAADEFGYYGDSGIKKMPLLPYPVNGVITDIGATDRMYFLSQMGSGSVDTEPDLFCFNFNGYQGKFVFDENRTPRLLEEQDLKIAVNFKGGKFASWIITTPDGVRYYFGENNLQEINTIYNNEVIDNQSTNSSSWLLNKIIYPNSKDTVTLNYATESYGYFDLSPETTVYDNRDATYDVRNACSVVSQQPPSTILRTKVSGLRLTNITSKNFKIVFSAINQRQDLISYSTEPYPFQLDSIKILNSQNQCLKQFLLSYSYFTSTTATGASSLILSVIGGNISDTKRLKLTSVKELSGDGLLSKPAYIILYNEQYQLPRRMSYDQDHWGYSNNFSGNSNDRFTPRVEHQLCSSHNGIVAFRNPSWPSMQSFSIKSLKDPLGVTTTFDFESHTSSMMYPSRMVGGLRIHQITATDSVTGLSNIRTYEYSDGGVIYNVPKYIIDPKNEYYNFTPSGATGASYAGYGFESQNYTSCIIKQSQSLVPLLDFQGNHIGYPEVKEIFGIRGEGGFKKYSFVADQYSRSTSRLDMSNFTDIATIKGNNDLVTGYFGNSHFNDINPIDLKYVLGYSGYNNYPFAPLQVDVRRGKLIKEQMFDSTGNLIHSVSNIYKEDYNENYWIRGFKLFRSQRTKTNESLGNVTTDNDALTYYKLHSGISHLTEKTESDYKDGKELTSTTRYGYESKYHNFPTSDTTVNSLGDTLINKTYYSFDYANNATSDNVFGKMKNRNTLLPVSKWQWRNNRLISGSITEYKDFASSSADTLINPVKIYTLETSTPLTTAQAGIGIALTGLINTFIPNSSYVEKVNFNYDGTSGKIIGQKLINNKNQALIWDNNYNLPLAQIENASYTDVAYSGFESTETGNWTFPYSSVVTDASAPTGTRTYLLSTGNAISKSGLASTQTYIVSYWLKSGSTLVISGGTQSNRLIGRTAKNWTYYQVKISGTTSISIAGTGNIDEVKIYPLNSQMTTYTYDPLLRLIATTTPNEAISYYEYDALNRLIAIKDQYQNIIKAFDYNYGRASRASQ